MKYFSIVLALIFIGCQPQTPIKLDGKLLFGTVINIIDGDTVTVRDANNEEHRIRLGEIDCPEKSQEYGREAAVETKDLLLDQQVKVFWKKKDSFSWRTTKKEEKHGRIIGGIYLNGRFINRELVERGAAWHYKEFSTDDTIAEAEAYAKTNKYGLWANPNAISPWNYRKKK